jgi:hypothetical protein
MAVIQPPEVQWVLILLQLKLGSPCDIFTPRVQPQETNCASWPFHVDDCAESSSTYDMIIGNLGNQTRSSWTIRHNHELQ